ncbi:magnesium-translocating P-type ATPase [Aetokthonos hydrillicola Thurmond2011]|jgi:Mg2+-importing ATPase|uniref:Magnesium-transporting ATPase, P-type 1 n=1 Tax=Aetokthonos hydrillicola Thurmond2011 TaxID=2712845 RepID=A0AAP5IH14_9CYAN|nr:magnesium-translocating P-type ATPase [Aetokthonos hydrillicola]MBW4586371.1 magnesium-translocating P-type ATPase [Aetokthonos hydrillicola CCALA 1050]MDR9899923.1 magnesium-translocating P-type ATPase [Aetokthonos hydrillicola Thurmond2011]
MEVLRRLANSKRNSTAASTQSKDWSAKLINIAHSDVETVLQLFDTSLEGLSETRSYSRLQKYGLNEIAREKPQKWYIQLLKTFQNPLAILLIALAIISMLTGDAKAAIIILVMVTFSVILRFSQEFRSSLAAEKLREMVRTTCTVSRRDKRKDISPDELKEYGITLHPHEAERQEISIKYLVPGDVIYLAAGDMIPADVRLISAKDLFVSQGSLTGESLPVEKYAVLSNNSAETKNPLELGNLCFLGTNVVSGSGTAVVIETGSNTYLGSLAKTVVGHKAMTSFDKGVNGVSLLLLRFMMIMVPVVFLINGFLKGNWAEAFFFALSVAVGLTPEMLPMIVTANLGRGALAMSDKKVIVKNIDAIQNFGAMDILCTDKTGTLTQDKIVLKIHLDIYGEDNEEVLEFAYLNSFYQTGLKNLLDVAVLEHIELHESLKVEKSFSKIDEIPFDFVRRRMSVVVEEDNHHHELICKGAVEEILQVSTHAKANNEIVPIDESIFEQVTRLNHELNEDGLRVIAVAYKELPLDQVNYSVADEKDLILLGFIAFLDPPKDSAEQAIAALNKNGVAVKILTGDNDIIARKICKDVSLYVHHTLLGSEIEGLSDDELADVARTTTIFAKLSPVQKARIISVLRGKGHIVGFMGDGINDAPALREADVGISVDTAVDIAKESADIILLEKSLLVLEEGVIEGRKTFANIVKYIKMGTSSNFGNMFSMLGASALLPFLPMQPVQILVNNLLYDFSQTGIPFDNVDKEYLSKPRKWQIGDIQQFMLYIGPISSIFDYTTYALMWFVFGANSVDKQALFNTGWFVESLMTQTLIVYIIRTAKIPFIQSWPALPMLLVTVTIMAVGIYLPFSPISSSLGFVPLPANYFLWLLLILLSYCFLTQFIKTWFIKRYGYN